MTTDVGQPSLDAASTADSPSKRGPFAIGDVITLVIR